MGIFPSRTSLADARIRPTSPEQSQGFRQTRETVQQRSTPVCIFFVFFHCVHSICSLNVFGLQAAGHWLHGQLPCRCACRCLPPFGQTLFFPPHFSSLMGLVAWNSKIIKILCQSLGARKSILSTPFKKLRPMITSPAHPHPLFTKQLLPGCHTFGIIDLF